MGYGENSQVFCHSHQGCWNPRWNSWFPGTTCETHDFQTRDAVSKNRIIIGNKNLLVPEKHRGPEPFVGSKKVIFGFLKIFFSFTVVCHSRSGPSFCKPQARQCWMSLWLWKPWPSTNGPTQCLGKIRSNTAGVGGNTVAFSRRSGILVEIFQVFVHGLFFNRKEVIYEVDLRNDLLSGGGFQLKIIKLHQSTNLSMLIIAISITWLNMLRRLSGYCRDPLCQNKKTKRDKGDSGNEAFETYPFHLQKM